MLEKMYAYEKNPKDLLTSKIKKVFLIQSFNTHIVHLIFRLLIWFWLLTHILRKVIV